MLRAICVIGAGLADGLQYAHERNLLHMDIKPSNVLLAGDGQPMLLDFHLAQAARAGCPPALVGRRHAGLHVARALGRDHGCPRRASCSGAVDRRADIYSLGVLLYEALGGTALESPGALMPPVRRFNPRVSPGLSDVIQKCLCDHPAGRYRQASDLANDLRRHLSNLPLRGVSNRSMPERWRKWRRRRPGALSRGIISVVLAVAGLVAVGSLGLSFSQRMHDADSALAQGRALLERHRYTEAADALKHGMGLAERIPGSARRRSAFARACTG